MSLGYRNVSPPGAVGRSFKCDVGGRPLQCHSTSDGWRDAARVPGLPEPADRALAPQTQEDQLRETLRLTGRERERKRLSGKLINYVHTHTHSHKQTHTQIEHTCIFAGVCFFRNLFWGVPGNTGVCVCVFCPVSDCKHGDDSSSQWKCSEHCVCLCACEFSERTATLRDQC